MILYRVNFCEVFDYEPSQTMSGWPRSDDEEEYSDMNGGQWAYDNSDGNIDPTFLYPDPMMVDTSSFNLNEMGGDISNQFLDASMQMENQFVSSTFEQTPNYDGASTL